MKFGVQIEMLSYVNEIRSFRTKQLSILNKRNINVKIWQI